nr:hypothetical protein [Tanacetum cinerariifolium]
MSNPHQELTSPDQTVSGKDSSNPLMVDNFPKIVWYSTHHVALMKSWLVQKQTALGKDESNLFIVDSLLKAIWKVEALDQDKVAQAFEIIKLKQRVKKLERKNKLKVSGLRRLTKVGTAQRVKSSRDTVIDDVSKQGDIIANMDSDKDVTLKDVATVVKEVAIEKDAEIKENADVQGSATITAADTLIIATIITIAPSVDRRRKGVVIRDPKETTTPSIIIHSEPKSNDKGKGIMVKEPKTLKKQA